MSKGGAPGFFAPEVALAKAGRGKFIDYSGADAFTCGMLLHGVMCVGVDLGPFAPEEDPRRFQDADYREPPSGTPEIKAVVRGLLRVGLDDRLSAADALARVETMNAERRVERLNAERRERETAEHRRQMEAENRRRQMKLIGTTVCVTLADGTEHIGRVAEFDDGGGGGAGAGGGKVGAQGGHKVVYVGGAERWHDMKDTVYIEISSGEYDRCVATEALAAEERMAAVAEVARVAGVREVEVARLQRVAAAARQHRQDIEEKEAAANRGEYTFTYYFNCTSYLLQPSW
jgi:hypothetical protein